jgi:hypothetical protein
MALRFRRGSESDRTNPSFVPEDGEPVWIVDTKRLYIGDGSTAGGVLVTGSGGGVSITGIDDNTTGVVLTLDNATSTFTNDVELDSSDLILAGGTITGTGNINILGNITGSGTLTGNIANVGSLNVTSGIDAGGTINAPYFVGDHLGSVFATDSSLIIDGINNQLTIDSAIINTLDATTASLTQINDRAILKFVKSTTSDISASNDLLGTLFFQRDDANGLQTPSLILGGNGGIYMGHNITGTQTEIDYLSYTSVGLGVGTFTPIAKLDIRGNAIITGSLTAGAILLSGSNIDTDDSSVITITPAAQFSSDVTVDGNLNVQHTLVCETLQVTNFQTAGAGTPELSSDTAILLTAGTRVEITQSPIKMASFTTTERNALSAQNGDLIYNTTDNKFQGYENGSWVNLV